MSNWLITGMYYTVCLAAVLSLVTFPIFAIFGIIEFFMIRKEKKNHA